MFASSASDVEAEEDEETELEDTEDEEEPDSDIASETRTAWVTSWAGTTGARLLSDDSEETDELEEPVDSDSDAESS